MTSFTEYEIFHLIRAAIAEDLSVDEAEITSDKTLIDLGADSIDISELNVRLKEIFENYIPENFFDEIFFNPNEGANKHTPQDGFTIETIMVGIRKHLQETGKLEVGASSREAKLEIN